MGAWPLANPPPPSDTPASDGADGALSYPITIALLFSTVPLHTQCTFIMNGLTLMSFGAKIVSNSYSLFDDDEFVIKANCVCSILKALLCQLPLRFSLKFFGIGR